MKSMLDKNGKARVPFDPELYRNISYERVKRMMSERGCLHWPNEDPARAEARRRFLDQGDQMPISALMQLICEYEAGELNRDEILQLFGSLIGSELITLLPFDFQYIAFQLVIRGAVDPFGMVRDVNDKPMDIGY